MRPAVEGCTIRCLTARISTFWASAARRSPVLNAPFVVVWWSRRGRPRAQYFSCGWWRWQPAVRVASTFALKDSRFARPV